MTMRKRSNDSVRHASALTSDSVRKPCAIVVFVGDSTAARAESTWIHWRSSVASANLSIGSSEMVIQSLTPISRPIRARSVTMSVRSIMLNYDRTGVTPMRTLNADDLKALQTPLKQEYKQNPAAALVTLRASGKATDGISCK